MSFINQFYHYNLCCILIFVFGYCVSNALSHPPYGNNNITLSMRDKHDQWMATYSRTYKDLEEKEKCFNIFKKNVEHIENFNRASSSKHILYTLGVNEFADLTNEEFLATHTDTQSLSSLQTKFVGATTTNFKYANITDVPLLMDWRQKGAVTRIKNQNECGCCWAFVVVATIEGLNQIKTGRLISLSEQELVDCDQTNQGCAGGDIEKAFTFIKKKQGILTDQVYPYKGIQGKCQIMQGQVVTIKGYEVVPTGDESALLKAVSKQPVAVRIDSSGFMFYRAGIYHWHCGRPSLNHGVTIVGYGTANGDDYWLVKNTWGENWGEHGYMKILRGKNICGVATTPFYPI